MQTIGTDGIFGDPVYVAAKYAFLFVLFGNLFVISGGAQLFFDLAAAVTGRSIGGPAKACIVSSALYGTVSGSPVADVATTGPVTIPIMKRIGMSAEQRRRDRGGVLDRRRAAAAGDGSGRFPDGGLHRHALLPDRLVRPAAVARLLPRRLRARAFRGGAPRPWPHSGAGHRRAAGGVAAQLAEHRSRSRSCCGFSSPASPRPMWRRARPSR